MSEVDDDRIQPALHAMLAGDSRALDVAIQADPEIVTATWQGNTLLEWVTQPPHGVSAQVVDVLIDHGSALDRALNLAGCFNLGPLCERLLAAGADPAARADADITPLESAALHGSTESADVLALHGLHRPSLWLAAAAGQLDEVQRWVATDGTLLRPPGPYRPNLADVGHPPAAPTTDAPAELLAEALVFAAANGRTAVVDYLVTAGVDIDARPYLNTTGLHLAIMFGNERAVSDLLQRGAATDILDERHASDAPGWSQACLSDEPASQAIAELVGRAG